MILSIIERIILQQIVPRETSVVRMRILRTLHKDLGFTEQEIKDCGIKDAPNGVQYNPSAEVSVDIPIGEQAAEIIKDSLSKTIIALNKQEKVTAELLNLCERFIDADEIDSILEAAAKVADPAA